MLPNPSSSLRLEATAVVLLQETLVTVCLSTSQAKHQSIPDDFPEVDDVPDSPCALCLLQCRM
jgi:hypothetical protein